MINIFVALYPVFLNMWKIKKFATFFVRTAAAIPLIWPSIIVKIHSVEI